MEYEWRSLQDGTLLLIPSQLDCARVPVERPPPHFRYWLILIHCWEVTVCSTVSPGSFSPSQRSPLSTSPRSPELQKATVSPRSPVPQKVAEDVPETLECVFLVRVPEHYRAKNTWPTAGRIARFRAPEIIHPSRRCIFSSLGEQK